MQQGDLAIIGSGNLAWHLAGVLQGRTVYYRGSIPAEAWPCPLRPLSAIGDRPLHAVLLAVPDGAILSVSERLADMIPHATPVIHTSGATPLARIDARFPHRGVLWPIRSLRKREPVGDWKDLPLVVQANSGVAEELLEQLAGSLSDTVSWLDDRQRAQLHLAAVFSNNFVTALYEVAHDLCSRYHVPFEMLLPIIRHTASTQDGTRPAVRQTGAAARGDRITMQRHLDLLDRPAYQDLYERINALILEYRLTEHDANLRSEANDDL